MSELVRPVLADRIPDGGQAVVVEAGPDELTAIAARLLLPAVATLSCRWQLVRGQKGMVLADGLLQASVTQECGITMEPFPARIAETFSVRFILAGRETEESLDPDEPDELVYDGVTIDLGEATVEQLALALDPYPRKPGAELPGDLDGAPANAFAALARLQRDG